MARTSSLKRTVKLGAIAPVALTCTITGDGSVDFSTVTAADISVRRPNGEEFWIVGVTISAQTTDGLTVTHPWVTGEVNVTGRWATYARLYVPGGSIDTDPGEFDVVGPYAPVTRPAPP